MPIEEVACRYTELEPLGGRAWFTGRCPLPNHEDRTPSFYIYPDEIGSRWWCYGCGRGGDVIDLEFHCGDYGALWSAMVSLAMDFSVELPERPSSWLRKLERQRPIRNGIEEAKVHECDVVVAATGDDKANLVVSLLSKTEFGVPRTVARVNDPRN